MIKKILSSIILIMIICSTCVCGNIVTATESTSKLSQKIKNTNLEDSTTTSNTESENKDADSDKEETDTSTDKKDEENSNANDNTNKNENTGTNKAEDDNKKTDKNQTEDKKEQTDDKKSQGSTKNNSQATTDKIVIKSNEARLQELKVDVDGLSPEFNKNTTEYYLVVDLSVEKIKVTTETIDDKAKVSISGNKNLKEGENTINIDVEAEDGTIKKYYIYVTKIDDADLANAELKSLEIQGFSLYPNFKSDIYTYNLNINVNIKSLNITAEPQMEKATVKVEGDTNLQEGENLIKVTVTAEDQITTREYRINTYINSEKVEIEEESKVPAMILIVVLITCIVGLGAFIIIKNKR